MAKKRFIVLGLGSFGSALARRLCANGCRVTGVDQDEHNVANLQSELHEAVVGDVTDREVISELSVTHADAVFISLGENIERSILAALHVRELGGRQIFAKGVSPDHGKILKKVGVDRVIFPEVEIAEQLADKATWPNVLESLRIDPEFSLLEIAVPRSLSGVTLMNANLRKAYGVLVVGVKDALTGALSLAPTADFLLTDDQLLLVIGKQSDLDRFRELH